MAFVLVLTAFAIGVFRLKLRRPRLRRNHNSHYITAFIGLVVILVALVGVILSSPISALYVILFLLLPLVLTWCTLDRVWLAKSFLSVGLKFMPESWSPRFESAMVNQIRKMRKHTVAFFTVRVFFDHGSFLSLSGINICCYPPSE
jgi:amino acid transporter